MITAIQLKVLVSGRRSTPPRRTRPHLLKQMPRLTRKVSSISTCQYRPNIRVDQANSVFTRWDTASMSTSAATRKTARKPPLTMNSGQSTPCNALQVSGVLAVCWVVKNFIDASGNCSHGPAGAERVTIEW
ncbi:hypothetical protein D3C78_1104050 [compost metagenome]